MSCGGAGDGGGYSKVETISRLAQWRIETFGPCSYRQSDSFKLGRWNWILSIEKDRYTYIRLYPEACRLSPPLAKFFLKVSAAGRTPYISPVQSKLFHDGEDVVWPIDCSFHGRFVIDVEFLDLKIFPSNGGEACSIWTNDSTTRKFSGRSTMQCLSRMLEEGIHADVTINTAGGVLRAHKAVLSASSPVFESMFSHDLKEKESSTIDIEDMSLEACSALMGCIYGNINNADFWEHCPALLAAANKYDISDLKRCCEESLLEDINSGNALERLKYAWLYQLPKLKEGCLTYLFYFRKIYDTTEDAHDFFRHADRELVVEIFNEMLSAWKPL